MSQIQMTGVCLFMYVVGTGFDSTSPTFVRSRASQEAGSDGRLVQKNGIGPPFMGARIVYGHFVRMSAVVPPCAGCVFLDLYINIISMVVVEFGWNITSVFFYVDLHAKL